MRLNRSNSLGLLAAVMIIAVDQWTKYMASAELSYGLPVEILSVFDLTLQHNTGAAFSFLADAGGWQRWFFTIVSAVVSLVLVVWLVRLRSSQTLMIASLSCILGGAIGNLWDRIVLGYVVDFISIHYQTWYFPTFNVADMAISIGAGLMILDIVFNPEHHKNDTGSGDKAA